MDFAECNSPSGGVCLCDVGYFHRDGACLTQTEAGNPCTGEEECTPNSVCAETCRCREGFFKVKLTPCNMLMNIHEVMLPG